MKHIFILIFAGTLLATNLQAHTHDESLLGAKLEHVLLANHGYTPQPVLIRLQNTQRMHLLQQKFTQRCVNRYGFYPQQAKLIITDDVPPTKIAGTFLEGCDQTGQPQYEVIMDEEFALNAPLNEVLAVLFHEATHAGKGHLLIDENRASINRMFEREADIDSILNDDNTINQEIVIGGLNNLAKKDTSRRASTDDDHPTPENRTAYWQDFIGRTTVITPKEKTRIIACGKEKVGHDCEQAIKAWLEVQRKLDHA